MSYDLLSSELQNIMVANHSYMTKWFVFLVIILLSAFYIWGVWPYHKQTRYVTQAILRLMFFGLAVVYLAVSPLMILLMSPEYSFLEYYLLPLEIYALLSSILGILLFVDILRLGFFYILGKAGLDLEDDNIKGMINSIEDNKHFLKMMKKRRN